MKKYLILFLTMLAVSAEIASYNPGTAITSTAVLTNPVAVYKITFANAAASAVQLKIFDSPNTNLNYVIGAYTNYTPTVTSQVTPFTNVLGVVTSVTNSVYLRTYFGQAQTTNAYKTLYSVTVPASSTLVFDPEQLLMVNFGLMITNSATNVTASIEYAPLR